MGILSRSITLPVVMRMFSTASFRMDRVLSPRKSILMSPVDSITCASYCVQCNLCPGSFLSSATDTGTQSLMGSRQIEDMYSTIAMDMYLLKLNISLTNRLQLI